MFHVGRDRPRLAAPIPVARTSGIGPAAFRRAIALGEAGPTVANIAMENRLTGGNSRLSG